VNAEGGLGDQSDLGVDHFDTRVGQAVLDRGDGPGALVGDRARDGDRARELYERWQATS